MRRINSLLQVYHIALKKKKKQQQLYTMIQLQKTRMHIFQYTGTIKMCTLNFRVAILPRVCFSLHDASDGRYMRFFQGCCTSLFSVYIKSCMLVIPICKRRKCQGAHPRLRSFHDQKVDS